jgi:hypothetical protein
VEYVKQNGIRKSGLEGVRVGRSVRCKVRAWLKHCAVRAAVTFLVGLGTLVFAAWIHGPAGSMTGSKSWQEVCANQTPWRQCGGEQS